MLRKKESVISACIQYGNLLESVFQKFEIRLYGSYHNGTATNQSDIDVAVICDEFKGIDYTLSLQILNRLKSKVDSYIEPISMYFDELTNPLLGSIEAQVSKSNELVYKSRD